MTAAMAQYLAIDDGPEDDRAKAAAALPDAIAGARTPVVRTDCCRTSIKECSRTWGCYEQRYRLTGLIGRPLAAGLVFPAVGTFSSCRSPSNQTSAPSAGSEEVAAIKTTPRPQQRKHSKACARRSGGTGLWRQAMWAVLGVLR
jgi:hypothetical protein